MNQSELRRQLHYDPNTGIFTRLVSTNKKIRIGDVAGSLNNSTGYIGIQVNGQIYQAHRLAYLYMEGYFPEYQVDHKNGVRDDNRWENLRHTTQSCNMQNQTIRSNNLSGFTGVSWNNRRQKWYSQIKVLNRNVFIGCYDDPLEAALARFTFEVQCPHWTCNYQSLLVKVIKIVWPEFKPNEGQHDNT